MNKCDVFVLCLILVTVFCAGSRKFIEFDRILLVEKLQEIIDVRGVGFVFHPINKTQSHYN